MSRHPLEPEADELRALTAAVCEFVQEHVLSLPSQPASDLEGAAALIDAFQEPPPESGQALGAVLERLRPAIAKSFNTAGPGYLAFIPGGGLYSAALADFIACAVNRYVGVNQAAPVLAGIERITVSWLAGLMGYPTASRGILTSGGSLANLSALVTARAARLPADFLSGTIYVSRQTHHSILKAARIAGWPEERVRVLPVDARFRMRPEALAQAVQRDRAAGLRPFLVVASVGSTDVGAVDALPELQEIARREDLWVHADAAYGGFFRIVPDGPALMPGLEACDSITLDPHKGLFLPYGTGCLLVRDGEALYRAHRAHAHYLQDVAGAADDPSLADLSPELSRDFRGLRVWLPLQLHGLAPFRAQLQEKLDLAREAYETLHADPHFETLDVPQLSIVAFTLREPHASGASQELLRRVNARGRVFLSSTTLEGRHVLRLCVLSFRTHAERLREALDALQEEARRLSA